MKRSHLLSFIMVLVFSLFASCSSGSSSDDTDTSSTKATLAKIQTARDAYRDFQEIATIGISAALGSDTSLSQAVTLYWDNTTSTFSTTESSDSTATMSFSAGSTLTAYTVSITLAPDSGLSNSPLEGKVTLSLEEGETVDDGIFSGSLSGSFTYGYTEWIADYHETVNGETYVTTGSLASSDTTWNMNGTWHLFTDTRFNIVRKLPNSAMEQAELALAIALGSESELAADTVLYCEDNEKNGNRVWTLTENSSATIVATATFLKGATADSYTVTLAIPSDTTFIYSGTLKLVYSVPADGTTTCAITGSNVLYGDYFSSSSIDYIMTTTTEDVGTVYSFSGSWTEPVAGTASTYSLDGLTYTKYTN